MDMSGRARTLVDRGVARDPKEERDERKSAVLVSVKRFHRADEHVGYQVLRLVFAPVPRQAVRKTGREAFVELPRTRGISGLGGFDERSVDTRLLRAACRLTGDSRSWIDLRAPGHLVSKRR